MSSLDLVAPIRDTKVTIPIHPN